MDPEWVAMPLGTIPYEHRGLQQIAINPSDLFDYSNTGPSGYTDHRSVIGETFRRGWSELDRVLSRLRESLYPNEGSAEYTLDGGTNKGEGLHGRFVTRGYNGRDSRPS